MRAAKQIAYVRHVMLVAIQVVRYTTDTRISLRLTSAIPPSQAAQVQTPYH